VGEEGSEGRAPVGVLQSSSVGSLKALLEGAFARPFRSELQPVEVGKRGARREMDDRAAIGPRAYAGGERLVVELSETDHESLDVYAESLGVELATWSRRLSQGARL